MNPPVHAAPSERPCHHDFTSPAICPVCVHFNKIRKFEQENAEATRDSRSGGPDSDHVRE